MQRDAITEIHGLARRLESRARRERNKDLHRAGALLRLLMQVIKAEERAIPATVDRGRLH